MNEEIIKIEDIVDGLKKRWQLIVTITLIATIISAVVSFFIIKPKYEASAKLFVGKEASTENNVSTISKNIYKPYKNRRFSW